MLPVSGVVLAVREPTGADEVFVLETPQVPLAAIGELLRRVTRTAAGEPPDAAALPVGDLDAAALLVRRAWSGDLIRADTVCPAPGCGERIDVAFGIEDYLAHHRPRRARGVTEAPQTGWFTLDGPQVRFRIPTVADLLAASTQARPQRALSDRCVDAAEWSQGLARRVDRALAALAPVLDDVVGGACPVCAGEVALRFDPLGYVLAELRTVFEGVYREVHALAATYGWSEETILALPRARRRRYAALIAGGRWAA